jgi:GcrA cell cycle regulator
MAWTDERIALLKQYWDEGRSASQIAETLGEGLSRNAVIGKAHRLGLAARPSPLKTGEAKPAETEAPIAAAIAEEAPRAVPERIAAPATPKTELRAPTRASAVPAAKAAEPARAPGPVKGRGKGGKVTLLDLNDRICKWPIGHPDEADFHFCGKPVSVGFPYCQEHCMLAYQAQLPRRDRPPGPPRPFGPNLPRPR